jgi:uncharacterized protein (DUF1330 family)
MAKGYWIARMDIIDAEGYAGCGYPAAVASAVRNGGGRYIVMPGMGQTPEGPVADRQAVIEFPSYRAAVDCYFGAEYQSAITLRLPYTRVMLSIVEGV